MSDWYHEAPKFFCTSEQAGLTITPTAARHNTGKPELSQLLLFRLEALAAHCTVGRQKYPDVNGRPNWLQGGKPDAEYLDAIARHLQAIVRGDTYDAETGTFHAAAIAWNALALITLNYSDEPVLLDHSPTPEKPEGT